MKRILRKTTLCLAVAAMAVSGGANAAPEQGAKFQEIDSQLAALAQAVKSNTVLQPISAQPQTETKLPPQTQKNGVQTFSAPQMITPSDVQNLPAKKPISAPVISAERPSITTTDISAMVAGSSGVSQSTNQPQVKGQVPSVKAAPQKTSAMPTVDSVARGTKLGELPPLSRFEFTRSVFIPANKIGVLFVNGAEVANIESSGDPVALMNGYKPEARVCMLLSDKNYIMMRGAEASAGGRNPSYLDVESVEFFEAPIAESKASIANTARTFTVVINFLPKSVSLGEKSDSVQVSLKCRVPPEMSKDLKAFSLEDVNMGYGGLFKFTLPRYTEI